MILAPPVLARRPGARSRARNRSTTSSRLKGLGDVVVAARGKAGDAVLHGVLGGQQRSGRPGICSRSLCKTSSPLMSGSITSSTTTSGGVSRAAAMALAPSPAVAIFQTLVPQGHRHQFGEHGFVVDHQHVDGVAVGARS